MLLKIFACNSLLPNMLQQISHLVYMEVEKLVQTTMYNSVWLCINALILPLLTTTLQVVGQHLTTCWATAGRLLGNSRSTVGGRLADSCPTTGKLLGNGRSWATFSPAYCTETINVFGRQQN